MPQSKTESFIEAVANNGSGFLIAFLLWAYIVAPLIKQDIITVDNNFIITTIFFFVSFARSYLWRRFFARGLHKNIHKIVGWFK